MVASRPGCGKSALLLQVMTALASRGHPVGMCSIEMPSREIFNRLAAHRYKLNLSALTRRHGDVARDLDRAAAANPMSTLPMHFDCEATELPAILSRAHEWHYRHGIKALFVDYTQLVDVRGSAPRHEKIGEISRALKQIAKRLAIPVIAAAQFNREVDRDARRPRLSDLRESGAIEQDADLVLAINPAGDPDGVGLRSVEIGILKNRSGTTGWLSDPITFDGRTQSFVFPNEAKSYRERK